MREVLLRLIQMRARGQVASLDIIISTIVLLILLATIAILIVNSSKPSTLRPIYGGAVFDNLDSHFLHDYMVNDSELISFQARGYTDIKSILLNNSNEFDYSLDETCMFFVDAGTQVGVASGPGGCNSASPCPSDEQAMVFVSPVLKEDTSGDNKILNMFVVVCR